MARPHKVGKGERQLPALLQTEQVEFDAMLTAEPIPKPKPWSDELERAAIAGCAYATPPLVSLTSLGVPHTTAAVWLSEDPPEAFRSACVALTGRLKKASSWCERSLLSRIAVAGSEPSRWQANAWILERSKAFSHQYVAVADQSALGPSVVVNVGQIIVQGDQKKSLPRSEPIIEADVIPVQSLEQASRTNE